MSFPRPVPRGGAATIEPAPAAPKRTRVSAAIWIPIIWYAIETTQSISRWMSVLGFQVEQAAAGDGTPIDRNVYTGLLVLAVLVLVRRRLAVGAFIRANPWLTTLFVFMLVSFVWSDYPGITLKRWIRALGDLMMVFIVVTDPAAPEAQYAVIRRVMFFNIPLSIILIKYFRLIGTDWDETGMEMWRGATPHKNVLGQVVMVGALYFLFEIIRGTKGSRRLACLAYLAMCFWILAGSPTSRSNTSILGFVIGTSLLITLAVLKSQAERIRIYAGVIALVGVAVFGGFQLLQSGDDGSIMDAGIEATGRDATLTGRTELWADLRRIAAERPIVGVGYGAFWVGNTHHLWDIHIWGPTQGHNGYLDVYLEIGLVGIVLLVCVIVSGASAALNLMAHDFWQGAFHFILIVVIVIHNFAESSYLRGAVDLWYVFLLAVLCVPRLAPAVAAVTVPARLSPRPQRRASTGWGSQVPKPASARSMAPMARQ